MSDVVSTWQPTEANITLSQSAIKHLQNQIKKQGHGIGMRFGIKKSGCSGFAYQVEIIDATEPEDKVFYADNLIIAVAIKHLPILQGTEIDYVREGVNHHFNFKNPNETASCGCGESFSVDPINR